MRGVRIASARKQIQIILSKSFEILSAICQILAQMFFPITSCYNKAMAEGQEIQDREGDAGTQNHTSESRLDPSDAQREAVEDLADKVDGNKVEAAGQKGGLRGALSARFDNWHNALLRLYDQEFGRTEGQYNEILDRLSSKAQAGKPHGRETIQVIVQPFRDIQSFATKRGPLLLGAIATEFLRDRLQPKTQAPKTPQTTAK